VLYRFCSRVGRVLEEGGRVLNGCWTSVGRVLDEFCMCFVHVGRVLEEIYIQLMLHNIYFENGLRDNFNFHQIFAT